MEFNDYNFFLGLSFAIVAVFAVVLIAYLKAEAKNNGKEGFKKATALKLALSGMFCVVALISYHMTVEYSHASDIYFAFNKLIIFALICAFFGDFFLQYIRLDNKKYKVGIAFFIGTQALLIAMLVVLNLLNGWPLTLIITIAVLALVGITMKKQRWELKSEKKLLSAYTVLLTFMAAKAIATMFHDKTYSAIMFAVGASLFLLSDLLLGIYNYGTNKRIHANLNWITYFSGMMLIALSSNPFFSGWVGW